MKLSWMFSWRELHAPCAHRARTVRQHPVRLGRMLHHQLCSMVTLPSLDMLFGLHYETAHGIHFTTQSDISQLLLHLLRVNPSGFLQPFLYDLQSCSV
mmetsp:Transcript_9423/g.15690  ORF Transcript_9423/g.15690 Transcript_9423/m.15690 type:complete len:98 (-) Transcript_9423:122-415(-)